MPRDNTAMAINITGKNLRIEDVVAVARSNEKITLDEGAVARMDKCRAMLEKKIVAREIMYGVNTGIGEFSEVVLNDDQVKQFQKYLIYNHAAGIGKPCPIEHVRAALLSRIAVHTRGHSGCRPEIALTYVEMLNRGLTPVVCQKGSVGACGDLAPMAQLALLLMGEGDEQRPMVIVRGASFVKFTNRRTHRALVIRPEKDLYYPLLKAFRRR